MLQLKNCSVRWDKDKYIPKKISGFQTVSGTGTPRAIAMAFLKKNAEALKIIDLIRDLKYEKTGESLGARKVLFQQYFRGTPIHGAWVAVHVDHRNRVFMVRNDTVPIDSLEERVHKSKAKPLSAVSIQAIIKKRAKEHGWKDSPIRKESMIYAYKNTYRKVWKVKFGAVKPMAIWILFIDKSTGHVIDQHNIIKKGVTGKGRVFIPNPIVALNRDDLYNMLDRDAGVFQPAYKEVALHDLKPGGYLIGPYVDTTATRNPAFSAELKFIYNRYNNHFEEVMAYYHIDTVQRYIQSLGFKGKRGILNRSIKVNAHCGPEDNSYYNPMPEKKDLNFGDGGVDDAEDADIILHEYGHALQDDIISGFGQSQEGGAMGEGFGDYLAASFFEEYKTTPRKVRFAEWDVKAARGNKAGCLRYLNSPKHYPENMTGEVHDDGEIWSACLWKVRKLLGRKKADTVILESHFYLTQYCDFQDGAEAIIVAEKNLYGGKNSRALTKIFEDRGIL